MRRRLSLVLAAFLLLPFLSLATPKGGSSGSTTRSSSTKSSSSSKSTKTVMKQTGFPHGRKGYVVDHIVPLECGGTDDPSNMQWQTVADAKVKDRTEAACRR